MGKQVFDHILIIMFENEYRGYVLENDYMRSLASLGIELTNYFGVMHPSQTNYLSSIAGELCGVTDDDVHRLPQRTIVDLIEQSPTKVDWKAYMQSYIADDTPWQADDFKPKNHYPYVMKHNPFSSFSNILENKKRWERIDNEAGFWKDISNGTLPSYAWFTPNMWNDGHYLVGTNPEKNPDEKQPEERAPILVDQQAKWLQSFFDDLKFPSNDSLLPPNTLVVVTYDEADFEKFYSEGKKYTYDGPNQVYTVLLGDMINPAQNSEGYNHYSLLKTVQKNFHLESLNKNDTDANWFQFLWEKSFSWQTPIKLMPELEHVQAMTGVEFCGQLYLIHADKSGHIKYGTTNGLYWSEQIELADDCLQHLSVAANDNSLMLVYRNTKNQLVLMRYTLNMGWQTSILIDDAVESVDLIAIPNQAGFILVYSDFENRLYSHYYDGAQWAETQEVLNCNVQSSPDSVSDEYNSCFCLATLGATVLLIYREGSADDLSCLTLNTEPFNQLSIPEQKYSGPCDNTGVYQWSKSSFPVTHFSTAASHITPMEGEPCQHNYQASGTLATATLDGVIHLVHNSANSLQLITETFSLSGILTPVEEVSYDPNDKNTSNGYGTMLEAGWSTQSAVNSVIRDNKTPMTMVTFNNQLWLFYQPHQQSSVHSCLGLYQDNREAHRNV